MKKLIYLFIMLFALASCTTYKTYSAGKDDVSYVVVLSNSDNYKNVEIRIDGHTTTLEKVFKKNKMMKSPLVQVTPGQHTIEVRHKDKVLFSEKVYIGLQETKKIMLP